MTETAGFGLVEQQQKLLPPGWEAVPSDKNRVYYWNKKTGATTWNFPEQAVKEHVSKVRRHTYENMMRTSSSPHSPAFQPATPAFLQQQPASPTFLQQQPASPAFLQGVGGRDRVHTVTAGRVGTGMIHSNGSPVKHPMRSRASTGGIQLSASSKQGYENVVVLTANVPQYEQISSPSQQPPPPVQPPLPWATSEPLSPSPPLPDRKYSDSDMMPPAGQELSSPPPGGVGEGGQPSAAGVQLAPLHQVSATGNEYAIVNPKHLLKKHRLREEQEGGVVKEEEEEVPEQPPTLPLRAHERMRSREDLLADVQPSPQPHNPETTTSTTMKGDYAPSATPTDDDANNPVAYSVVKLDPVSGRGEISEETLPLPVSPQPYEVASPTPSASSTFNPALSSMGPHYEEIESGGEVSGDGYMKVDHNRINRPRGFSSPPHLSSPPPSQPPDPSPLPLLPTPLEEGAEGKMATYDLPMNSRKLAALNVTLRRNRTPQSEYAKLSLSKEALLLRSGVTLRRGRESLSSLSSYASRTDTEGEGQGGGGNVGSDEGGEEEEEDAMEPIVKCIKNLETSLKDSPSPETAEFFNLILPPSGSPSWVNFQRRPHAYEEIMGASQEELDWDESDLGGTPPPPGGETCEMVKVEDRPVQEPRARVLKHQYEEVELEGAATPPPTAQAFPARYLGWMPVTEDKLVTGQCVRAVHNCISKMVASKDTEKGEEVLLQVKGMNFHWLDPTTQAPVTTQLINRIRVWGIGLENERDFGYVARDASTRLHRCHIFRCSMAARAIAHVLLETHQRQRLARQKSQSSEHGSRAKERGQPVVESSTPLASPSNGAVLGGHEHYERFSCTLMGCCTVGAGQGMQVLNEAVDRLRGEEEQWQDVIVDVAISNITIADSKTGRVIREHRVRYLSFLGIARDDSYCGYILESGGRKGERQFMFYGFHMEPNTDRLCLALHSACQARYKRVLELQARTQTAADGATHPGKPEVGGAGDRRSSASLFGRLGSLKKSKKGALVESKSFLVHYLGCQAVSKVDGLETVRPVVGELAMGPNASAPALVEFDIAPTGLSVWDPQSSSATRKDFPVKNITYVVKIRNYFAFVAKEKGKYNCHAFMESKVDAGTVVTTIQNTLVPRSAK